VIVAGATGDGSILGGACAERQHVQDGADVRVILHIREFGAIDGEARRRGHWSDAGSIRKDEFRIREITQRCPGPAVEIIKCDDVGLRTIRSCRHGTPSEI
jgi:hypothetical protein